MKVLTYLTLIGFLLMGSTIKAQEYYEERLGLPGDNLNLFAVMKIFQESETLQEFEETLNSREMRINNLDLNGDNRIDYIKVIDYTDKDVHTIVLQVPINRRQNQDVAVFTIVRDRYDKDVQIQLVGDEDLYGPGYIVEPNYDDYGDRQNQERYNNVTFGNIRINVIRTSFSEIARWPIIKFIYRSNYDTWMSPWGWGYYPPYWRAWKPFYWDYYYGYHYDMYRYYYGHYRLWNDYRSPSWRNNYYHNQRSYSDLVNSRRNRGYYNKTYSKPETRRDGIELYRRTNKMDDRDYNNRIDGYNNEYNKPRDNGSIYRRSNEKNQEVENYNQGKRQNRQPEVNRPVTKPEPIIQKPVEKAKESETRRETTRYNRPSTPPTTPPATSQTKTEEKSQTTEKKEGTVYRR